MTSTLPAPRALRPYQTAAADAVEKDWSNGKTRCGVVLPTGSGKSTVIGELARRALDRGQRAVALAHRGELLDQMRRDFIAVAPQYADRTGIVRSEVDDSHADMVFATLQTLATAHRRQALGERQVILWDEVHHAGAEGFHTTFTELGGYDRALMAGFTATMYRDGRGVIGLGDVIEKVSYEKDIAWAIKMGFLVKPHGLTVKIKGLDKLDDVRNVAGDFHQAELAEVMEAATQYVVDAIQLHAEDRQPIIFAASVDAAHHIADSLTAAGYRAEAVTGAMPYAERQPVYARFRSGEARALVTVQVLTEGADFPMCDTVVLARPTRSKNLYSQMVGRALRLHPGKTDALVLDLAGSARHMKLVSLTQLLPGVDAKEVDEDGNTLCPNCGALLMGQAECYACADIPLDDGLGGGEEAIKQVRQGPVELMSIDLLASSDNLWMETTGRVPFIPLMNNSVVFLWPEDGVMPPVGEAESVRWAIGQATTRAPYRVISVTGSGRYQTDNEDYVSLVQAIDGAETWILESDQQLPEKGASWRRKQKPSEPQINYARTLGIPLAEDMTKAELSDEISVKITSRVLDRYLG
ncbi:type III restriction helicase [Mycobacterium phage Julie1]|jgi:DNA repair protein RadD|uniref:Type III restriction helicase n=1 Tax=Mycobacterium phage Julie1 TaxID=1463812 RepID=W8ECQ3_9CAUD|nr:DNA helicase [Mycobacterium phage Julie1]AHJ88546.1 type III restriction helicase [Mycobacterium phage Julie1]